MDDAGRPLDAPGEPDGTESSTSDADMMPVGDPVAAYAPLPREEATPRLDLERDPFAPAAPAYPVLDPEPFVPAIDATVEPVILPDEPASGETDEPASAEGESDAETTAAAADPESAEPAAQEPPASDGFDAVVAGFAAAAGSGEAAIEQDAADLSLEEMVGNLESAADSPEPPTMDETGEPAESEAEAEAGAETDTESEDVAEEAEAPSSWRDAVAASETTDFEGPELARDRLSTKLPFWLYGASWAIFVGVMTYLMTIWPC